MRHVGDIKMYSTLLEHGGSAGKAVSKRHITTLVL